MIILFEIYRNWFIFELILGAILWIPSITRNQNTNDYVDGFYTLRMIGALQYLQMLKDVQIIVQVIGTTLYGMWLLLVLVLMIFTYFAIAGILLFKNSDPFHFRNAASRYVYDVIIWMK